MIYDYECPKCSKEYEIKSSIADDFEGFRCGPCGTDLVKVIKSAPRVIIKRKDRADG